MLQFTKTPEETSRFLGICSSIYSPAHYLFLLPLLFIYSTPPCTLMVAKVQADNFLKRPLGFPCGIRMLDLLGSPPGLNHQLRSAGPPALNSHICIPGAAKQKRPGQRQLNSLSTEKIVRMCRIQSLLTCLGSMPC